MNEEIIAAEIIGEDGEGITVIRNEDVVESVEHGMSRLYLSGPMTGIPNYNHELFDRVAKEFRDANFAVCSPAEFFDCDLTKERKEYMREAVKYLLEADTIVLLPGWEESKGARLEVGIATELDLIVVEYVENDEQAAKLPPVGGMLTSLDRMHEARIPPIDQNGDEVSAPLSSFTPVEEK